MILWFAFKNFKHFRCWSVKYYSKLEFQTNRLVGPVLLILRERFSYGSGFGPRSPALCAGVLLIAPSRWITGPSLNLSLLIPTNLRACSSTICSKCRRTPMLAMLVVFMLITHRSKLLMKIRFSDYLAGPLLLILREKFLPAWPLNLLIIFYIILNGVVSLSFSSSLLSWFSEVCNCLVPPKSQFLEFDSATYVSHFRM